MESRDKAKNSTKPSNLCCHYCRVSSKRRNTNKEIKVSYQPCSACRMSYCHLCLRKHLHVDPDQVPDGWTCQRCNNTCCCQFASCTKDHQHCYTYRRTQQRHAQAALKWTKKKKRTASMDGDEWSDEGSAPTAPSTSPESTPKRKKPRPTPVVREESNSQEEYIPEDLDHPPPSELPEDHDDDESAASYLISAKLQPTRTSVSSPGETFPVLATPLFFPLETTTILPTDFLTEKTFMSDGDGEQVIKEEPDIQNSPGISMWDWI